MEKNAFERCRQLWERRGQQQLKEKLVQGLRGMKEK